MTTAESMTKNPLQQITAFGQSVWYDGLVSGEEFARLIREDGVRGATTNPTIFEKAILSGKYSSEIRAARGKRPEEIFRAIAIRDVAEIARVFEPLFKESGGEDGYVSIEVSPELARDTAGTLAEAKALFKAVDRPNVMIKIPATREGLPAIRDAIAEGIHVNVTLIFSIERYGEVIEAYVSGLEKRQASGRPVRGIASVASFFVSRVDTVVDALIDERVREERLESRLGRLRALKGTIAIANSKAAYARFLSAFSGERWEKLRAAGASVQRPLWASTGTKNPDYSDVVYVEALLGAQTVNTIPPATLDAYRDHGQPARRLSEGLETARQTLEDLRALGIDLKPLTEKLEADGVKAFVDSYRKILDAVAGELQKSS